MQNTEGLGVPRLLTVNHRMVLRVHLSVNLTVAASCLSLQYLGLLSQAELSDWIGVLCL